LTLAFLELQVDHSNLLFLLADLLLTVLEPVLLDVGLLIQNAQLIVTINQLDTHVVTALAGLLIIVD